MIFRPADDEAVPLYFVYSKPARRRQRGKAPLFRMDFSPRRGAATTAYFVYVEERQRSIGGKDTEKER